MTELLELETKVLGVVYFSRSCHCAWLVPCPPLFLWALTPRALTAMCPASFLHHRHFHLLPACSRPLHSRRLHPRCPVTVFSTSPIYSKFPVGRAGPPYITAPCTPPNPGSLSPFMHLHSCRYCCCLMSSPPATHTHRTVSGNPLSHH